MTAGDVRKSEPTGGVHPAYSTDSVLFQEMCNLFATRISPWSLGEAMLGLTRDNVDPESPTTIVLPVSADDAQRVFEFGYDEFLRGVCRSVVLVPQMEDVLLSEFDSDSVAILRGLMESGRRAVVVSSDSGNRRFEIRGSEFFLSAITAPISQLHSALVLHISHFQRYVDAVKGDTSRLFLRHQAASSFDAFLQGWVSAHFGVPQIASVNEESVTVVV